ncbi:MFS transporter [Tsukamurella pseudospumae]|uniref:Amino acid transporter n=1 Tax=Tsukamurella pseudospumae TaxID=239498 RepID=A0A138A850_9ACTN|nr:aromatic acid/H+ symport family MFS transporter [Tsukamurella pseudospumae]KXP06606.1 amino acid transporter [Tsukamurella pseudospumae]
MRTRIVTALCLFALVLEGYDILMFGLVVPSLLKYRAWGLTVDQVGWLGSIAPLGMLVGALAAAFVGDRIGRRNTLLGAVTVFTAAMVVCALAPEYALFAAGRFLIGLGAGMLMPTAAAAIVEFTPPALRNRMVTVGFAGTCVGGILAGALSLWLVPAFGFRAMFWAGAIPALVLLPLLWRAFPRESGESANGHSTGPMANVSAVFRLGGVRATVGFWVAMALCLLLVFGVAAWLPKLMQNAGYGLAKALSFLLILNVGALVGTLAGGALADRFGIGRVTSVFFVGAGAALLILAVQPPTSIAYALVLVAGAGTTGTQILLNAYVAAHYPASCRSAGVGLALGVGRLGAIAGPTYGAWIIGLGAGYAWQVTAFAIPALLGAVVVTALTTRPAGLARATRREERLT